MKSFLVTNQIITYAYLSLVHNSLNLSFHIVKCNITQWRRLIQPGHTEKKTCCVNPYGIHTQTITCYKPA